MKALSVLCMFLGLGVACAGEPSIGAPDEDDYTYEPPPCLNDRLVCWQHEEVQFCDIPLIFQSLDGFTEGECKDIQPTFLEHTPLVREPLEIEVGSENVEVFAFSVEAVCSGRFPEGDFDPETMICGEALGERCEYRFTVNADAGAADGLVDTSASEPVPNITGITMWDEETGEDTWQPWHVSTKEDDVEQIVHIYSHWIMADGDVREFSLSIDIRDNPALIGTTLQVGLVSCEVLNLETGGYIDVDPDTDNLKEHGAQILGEGMNGATHNITSAE